MLASNNLKKAQSIRRRLSLWYAKNRRSFIWRDTHDPYTILVSEIMLQQTQTSRIQEKLPQFLKQFPTLRALAESPRGKVIRAWQGIGYNNRAVRLHELAQLVLQKYNGRLPRKIEQLETLPGIGPYTSHAVASFAFGEHVPVVDVNIHRVLSRIFWKMKNFSDRRARALVCKMAARVLPEDSYSWNQAVMDLGSTICRAAKPLCGQCPVRDYCASAHLEYTSVHRVSARRSRERKPEPSYNGIPRRLWRGRIVEALRNVERDRPLAVTELGRAIKPDFRTSELPWLIRVVDRLAKDGVLYRVGVNKNLRVSLSPE
ncbi:MAG: hypothetical protein AUI33_02305 [Ignavibacteria bacterium 13_1_40CM_2_61_4]|nr:MAG: hypothetical protein AUI33_02305 [Ignavibacteria bacterium 13_1_40CM_2_61_4]